MFSKRWQNVCVGAVTVVAICVYARQRRRASRKQQLSLEGIQRTRAPLFASEVREKGIHAPPLPICMSDIWSSGAFPTTVIFVCLSLRDSNRLRCASSFFASNLSLDTIVPLLALLLDGSDTRRTAPGLKDVLSQTNEPTRDAIIDAVFSDALQSRGSFDLVLSQRDGQGRSPVQVAVQRNFPEAVKTLLNMRAQPDRGDSAYGWSPLMFAISSGQIEVAETLVMHGASVNYTARPHGYTPLLVACGMADETLVTWLLDARADPQNTLAIMRGLRSHLGKEHDLLKRVLDGRS